MTTIAVTRSQIAADGLVLCDGFRVRTNERKIIVRDNVIYAHAGTTALFPFVLHWIRNGADPDKAPKPDEDWCMIVIDAEDGPRIYQKCLPYPEAQDYPFAIGSGRDIARTAMRLGRSAHEAIEIACQEDSRSGGEIYAVDIASALGLVAAKAA